MSSYILFFIATIGGLVGGYVGSITYEPQLAALILFLVTLVCGYMSPPTAWICALVASLVVIPFAPEITMGLIFIRLAQAIVGAYIGVGIKMWSSLFTITPKE